MLKKIEDDLNKSITKRQNKMAEVRKEPNEKALIERQRQEIEEMRTNIKRMNVEHSGLQTKLDHLTRKVKGLQKNNEDLVLRLSKLASDKLVENNPAIADLSDQNRPTKLGEAFKELYDCKWTDAFEALATDGRSDEQAIRILRETLQNVAAFCKKKAEIFIQELDKVVVNVFDTQNLDDAELKRRTMIGGVKGAKLTKEEFKEMELFGSWTSSKQTEKKTATDIMHITMRRKSKITASMEKTRKEIAVTLLSSLQKAYFTHCLWSENYIPEMKPFIKECLRISWLTVVQRPPMCFLWEDGLVNRKATQVYVPYTRFGTVLDYIVWPALLLREEGEIIAKGVAQFKED